MRLIRVSVSDFSDAAHLVIVFVVGSLCRYILFVCTDRRYITVKVIRKLKSMFAE